MFELGRVYSSLSIITALYSSLCIVNSSKVMQLRLCNLAENSPGGSTDRRNRKEWLQLGAQFVGKTVTVSVFSKQQATSLAVFRPPYSFVSDVAHSNRVIPRPTGRYCTAWAEREVKHPGKGKESRNHKKEHKKERQTRGTRDHVPTALDLCLFPTDWLSEVPDGRLVIVAAGTAPGIIRYSALRSHCSSPFPH